MTNMQTRSAAPTPASWREEASWIAVLLACALLSPQALAQGQFGPGFNHVQTGFPLTGAHTRARCESCHVSALFKGTPRQCAACHAAGGRMSSVVMPRTHIQTVQTCDTCHNTTTFVGARFNHMGVAPGACMSCHNGMTSSGKPASHIRTTASCDSCHRTTAWTPARFTHAGVTPGTCMTCHNGGTASGKPANHIQTTASCDTCHRTTAWTPAQFSHAMVTPGTCMTCHNGSTASGKPANHMQTTASCDTCHRTTAWIPATFTHSTVAPGTCANCHNGTNARGKSANHFVTTRACDACHRTTAWTPATTYSHQSPFYRPHTSSVTCASCHYTNNEIIPWRYAAYKPDCAGCHANRYQSHTKVSSPRISYTVLELKDCSGSCHIYTDSTFTKVQQARTGQHRSTSGSF